MNAHTKRTAQIVVVGLLWALVMYGLGSRLFAPKRLFWFERMASKHLVRGARANNTEPAIWEDFRAVIPDPAVHRVLAEWGYGQPGNQVAEFLECAWIALCAKPEWLDSGMAIFVLWCALLAGDPNAYVVYHPSTGMLENVNLQGLSSVLQTLPRDATSLSAFAARVRQRAQQRAQPPVPTQLEAFKRCVTVAKQT